MGSRGIRRRLLLALLLAISGASGIAFAEGGASPSDGVLQHHRDAAHSGHYVVPSLTFEAARRLQLDRGFRATLQGPIYAQPLYWSPPDGGRPLLIVATEQNRVYGLDAASGVVIWQRSLGTPVPRTALPCGNIEPLGVTGTPVIDAARQAVFLDAMVAAPGEAGSAPRPRHLIFALAVKDGAFLSGWAIDVQAVLERQGKGFRAVDQNQRGALAILGDRLYVPYGGHYGDCGTYHGWVVGVPLAEPASLGAWSTRARGGGIWAPGGIVSDGRDLYVATGNSMGANSWGDGEAIIRLAPGPAGPLDFFTPADWRALDQADLDLGGVNPVLVSLPGASPDELVLALGKDGKAYLLDRRRLGGEGGALAVKPVSDGAIRTAPAIYPSPGGAHVAFAGRGIGCPTGQGGDLAVLRVAAGTPPRLEVAWCAAMHGYGSPIVTTTDGRSSPILWVVGAEGDNRLRGFRGDTGEPLFGDSRAGQIPSRVRRFQSAIVAGGRLYVAADDGVYAFKF